MKNKVIFFLTIFFLIFIFFTFYIGLNKPSLYKPKSEIKDIPKFSVITFFESKKLNSDDIFNNSSIFGFLAISLAAINIFGGFLVTQRMLAMYKKKKKDK